MKLNLKNKTGHPTTNGGLTNTHFSIDFVGKLQGFLVVYGWLDDPQNKVEEIRLFNQDEVLVKEKINHLLRFVRQDVDLHLNRPKTALPAGFIFFTPLKQITNVLQITFGSGDQQLLLKPIEEVESLSIDSLYQKTNYLTEKNKEELFNHLQKLGLVKEADLIDDKNDASNQINFNVDYSLLFKENFFLSGWYVDEAHLISEVSLETKQEVLIQNLKGLWKKAERKDVQESMQEQGIQVPSDCGFIWVGKLNIDEGNSHTLYLVLKDKSGVVLSRKKLPKNTNDAHHFKKVTQHIFNSFLVSRPDLFNLIDEGLGEFMNQLKPLWKQKVEKKVISFGELNPNPNVSIIIPLYGRWDLMNYQLAIFCNDQTLANHELIYVVDDPSIMESVVNHSKAVFPIYNQPYKVVYGGGNYGFAAANNLGVSEAKGQFLLLLNSDVIPKEKGWIDQLLQKLNELPNCGMVGPRLVYEDESIQHEGMTFERNEFLEGFWFNIHPGKGQPKWVFPNTQPHEVDALTGACMLLKKALYNELGGFDEGFVQGDFEDSDLNLKIRAKGLKPYLVPEIELYHLERKSQSLFSNSDWKLKLTLFNAWQQTKRWNQAITKLNNTEQNG